MSRYIFLVGASEYEGSIVCAAFESKKDAEALKAKCEAYDEAKPVTGNTDDTPEGNAAFDKQWAKYRRWENRHPGGRGASSYDTFWVQRIRLQEPKP